MQKVLPEIKFAKDPVDYDLVIIGTPIWGWNMCSLVRSYAEKNKGKIKKAAFFATMGGSGDEKAFVEMAEIIGVKPVATLGLKTTEVAKGLSDEKIKKFAEECGRQ
jgi:flavodoxin